MISIKHKSLYLDYIHFHVHYTMISFDFIGFYFMYIRILYKKIHGFLTKHFTIQHFKNAFHTEFYSHVLLK